jgi:hypothetical protein
MVFFYSFKVFSYFVLNIDSSISCVLQFLNKMLYAREGAKDILDRTCADLPWQLELTIDGVELEIAEVCTSI